MKKELIFVFDIDSTVIKLETLNDIITKKCIDKEKANQLNEISSKALIGEYDYHEAMVKRFYLNKLTKKDFTNENECIKNNLVEGIKDILSFISKNKGIVYFVSGGFLINILYVAKLLHIEKEYVYANDFETKNNELILKNSSLTYVDGKIQVCEEIKKKYQNPFVIMIGDGITDLNVWKARASDEFIGAGYVVKRQKIKDESKYYANSVMELKKIIENFFLQINA